ncbi:MAG: hypothetical protein Q9165_002168 [Trypethelium subeluteriae]
MQRACLSSSWNTSPSLISIPPFLAPRVPLKWPASLRSHRYLKIGPIRGYSYSRPVADATQGERNDGIPDQIKYEYSLPITYVEDLVESFGKGKAPLESDTPVTGTPAKKQIRTPSGETQDSFETYKPITSASHNERTIDSSGQNENSYGKYTRITSTSDTKDILNCSGETASSSGIHTPLESSGENLHLEESFHSSASPRTGSATSASQTYTQLRGAYPQTLDEQIEQPFSQGDPQKWQQVTQDALGPGEFDYSGIVWANKFMQVAREVEPDTQRSLKMMHEDMFEKASRLGKYLLQLKQWKYRPIFEFWQACVKLAPHTVPFLLCLLKDSPSKALDALLSSCVSSFRGPDTLQRLERASTWKSHARHFRKDALDFIATYYHETGSGGSAAFDEIYSEVMNTLTVSEEGSRVINGLTIRFLVKHCNQEQIASLHDLLLSKSTPSNYNTKLRFAYFFGENGQYRRAFEVLEQAISSGTDPKHEKFQSISTLALRRSMLSPNGYHDNPSIIATMLNLGIPINLYHYTVVILNAVEAEDHSTALRTYNLLKENGPITYPWAYSVMLKGCMSSFNIDTFRMVHRDILDSGMLSDDHVAGSLLAALDVFLLREHNTRNMAIFQEVIKVFCQIFDPAPLADLGILPLELFNASAGVRKATSFTVGVVLSAFVRAQIRRHNPDLFILEKTYRVFRRLVGTGHEMVAPLAETTFIQNAFLYAFAQSSDHLANCLDIMKDMAAPLPDTAVHQGLGRPIRPAHPDAYSWSILMAYFSRYGQTAAAERSLEIMQERGVRPNVVTWNTLAHGYSKAQDIDGMFGALLRMDASGFKMSDYTLKSLAQVKDRQKLLGTLARAQRTTYSETDRNLLNAGSFFDGRGPIEGDQLQENQITKASIGSDIASLADALQDGPPQPASLLESLYPA